jgi:protein-disulfide isomerase
MDIHHFTKRPRAIWAVLGVLSLVALGTLIAAKPGATGKDTASRAPSSEELIHYMRARLGVSDSVTIKAGAWHNSVSPSFEEATVSLDDGKPQGNKTLNVYVTKDGRYVGFGNIYALHGDQSEEIANDVRQQYKVPDTIGLTAGPMKESKIEGFYEVRVTASNGRGQDFFVTRDRRSLVVGNLLPFTDHPEEEALRLIEMGNQPSVGPAHSPVTIVEYADLECPSCAHMHQFLEQQFLPKYGDKVRVIFKEFPLVNIHPWALTGAIANECAYEISPSSYLPYRTLIFEHQAELDAVQSNASTVRDLLLKYGQQAGLDSAKLAACIDAKASLPRVEEGLKEGAELNLIYTPTFFINGREKVGMVPPEEFFRAVDEALHEESMKR